MFKVKSKVIEKENLGNSSDYEKAVKAIYRLNVHDLKDIKYVVHQRLHMVK